MCLCYVWWIIQVSSPDISEKFPTGFDRILENMRVQHNKDLIQYLCVNQVFKQILSIWVVKICCDNITNHLANAINFRPVVPPRDPSIVPNIPPHVFTRDVRSLALKRRAGDRALSSRLSRLTARGNVGIVAATFGDQSVCPSLLDCITSALN